MELSGSPDFGGAEMQEGNHQDRTLTDQKNGGEDYIRPRQDIFIAEQFGFALICKILQFQYIVKIF